MKRQTLLVALVVGIMVTGTSSQCWAKEKYDKTTAGGLGVIPQSNPVSAAMAQIKVPCSHSFPFGK